MEFIEVPRAECVKKAASTHTNWSSWRHSKVDENARRIGPSDRLVSRNDRVRRDEQASDKMPVLDCSKICRIRKWKR